MPKAVNWTQEELLKRIEMITETGCWIWMGYADPKHKYGRVIVDRKLTLAHRLSYSLFFGPIPDGMDICHRCDITYCVNPAHLFPGTAKDNMQDAVRKGRLGAKEFCRRGHPMSGDNLYFYKDGRMCLACRELNQELVRQREWNERRASGKKQRHVLSQTVKEQIASDPRPNYEIAEVFGVFPSTVYRIKARFQQST